MPAGKRFFLGLGIFSELAAIAGLSFLIYQTLFPKEYWQARELENNQAKWESKHITHYRMSLTIGCFCAYYFDGTMPLLVEVRDESVVSVVDSKGKTHPLEDAITISYLFRYAYGSILDASKSTGVTYDSTLGYPEHVSVAPKHPIPDDWNSFSVENLEILPP